MIYSIIFIFKLTGLCEVFKVFLILKTLADFKHLFIVLCIQKFFLSLNF